ncbi:dynein light chain KNAG_0C03200 [Huiozyma naganishii CBS 8797]|uniref:Dynein light chain n=1 Tax=Huiozyma naganishii (strain ATCC MYA-139 / BCRC 22969 / CBS 8797 / KCTC 17520 / NBRC 10181 / NCYC 3082 / Yp74L-3) TaxID=1071383 RepID=J7R3M2_HUIN7|nr:hypothetical protein KNAG_0C03200 [Kazachstania naganishii CBS 8797]CCK69430.1 hypothetical protein KNAG_0C03200 [Kazachstania naganishii CBS 8797]
MSAHGAGEIPEPILKASDISDEMRDAVYEQTRLAMAEHTVERDIASTLKKALDAEFGGPWHVVVGKNFGSYVTHEKAHFLYFYIGPLAFLVFKT